MKVRFVDRVVYVAARVAIGVAAFVPQWLGYTAADWLGRLWFRFDRRRQGYGDRFLAQAYPELSASQRYRLASRATGNLFKVPLDMARLTRLLDRGQDLRTVLDYTGSEHHLRSLPQPYLGLTAHLGNWEVAAVGVAQFAGGAHGVARISRNPLLERWILANREHGGLVIHPRRGGVRGLAKALAQGIVGLMVVDQNQRLRGVFAPFFGKLASCERAAASLALRHGYPIVVGAALRRGRGFRFELVAAPPIHLVPTSDKAADLLAAVGQINAAVEWLVRQAPEQYLWIHDRYRTQPKPGTGGGEAASVAAGTELEADDGDDEHDDGHDHDGRGA
jgi:KDO2-lipid IV(A) lauroyltransferase